MVSGYAIGALILVAVGFGVAYVGYRVTEGGDLLFPSNTDTTAEQLARTKGVAAILAGVATTNLGVALFFVPPTSSGWFILIGSYVVVCLIIGIDSWRQIKIQAE
jgi:hypothetical protein